MTEIERELTKSLKMQQEKFTEELQKITRIFNKSFKESMNEALNLIENQKKIIENYESELKSVEITINNEQMKELENNQMLLISRLEALERSEEVLSRHLEKVSKKLR